MDVPIQIDGYKVVEYGFFANPSLPTGYLPPPDGRQSLKPVRNLALCTRQGIDGYYLTYCTAEWEYVTYCFNETLEFAKRDPMIEFGQDVLEWRKRD